MFSYLYTHENNSGHVKKLNYCTTANDKQKIAKIARDYIKSLCDQFTTIARPDKIYQMVADANVDIGDIIQEWNKYIETLPGHNIIIHKIEEFNIVN